MPKKTRGRKRDGEEDASEPQPCCIFACERFGTRLLTSLRASYQLKEEHSGRVCEGHYRRDLRRFKKHSELNGSPSTTKSKRAQKDHDSDSMMVDGEDSKSTSSSRSSSPIDSAFHEASSPLSDSHHAPFYPYFKQNTVVPKVETPAIPIPAFPLAPATCASLASSSAIVGSPSFDLAQVNKFKMFCDFVLRNEGVTH